MPRGFRGWTFYLICLAGLLVPATILVLRGQFPEAGIWVLLGGAALWLELRSVRRELAERQAVSRLYVIDDSTQPSVETPQYELQLKRNP